LLLSKRHQSIVASAEAAHREQWGAEDAPNERGTKRSVRAVK